MPFDFSPEGIEKFRRFGWCAEPAEPMPPTSCRYVEPVPQHADEVSGAHYVHANTVATFVRESGFGKMRMIFAQHPLAPAPGIGRVELVSLLAGREPSVYVLDQMPTAQIARQAQRRPLDEFERLSLDAVRRGGDLVWTREAPMRMFGSIRAQGGCLGCHTSAREADLLGAFTYYLKAPVDQLEPTERFALGKGEQLSWNPETKPRPLGMSVGFTASNPVTVAAYRVEDAKDLPPPKPNKALGSDKGTAGTFTIDVPANVAIRIVTVNGDEADTQVELTLKTRK